MELDSEIEKNIPDLYSGMDEKDKNSLLKIKETLSKNIDTEQDTNSILEILKVVRNQFEFETFKKFVANLNDSDITFENMSKIANDWEYIETKELAQVAIGRIEAIKKLQKFIEKNDSEVKVIQPFLEKFPWLLDARLTIFQKEVSFSKLLKQKFPEKKLDESNKRIDFLCNAVGKTLIIIELKRPKIKITQKEITQAMGYRDFILNKYDNRFDNVETYLITNNTKMSTLDKSMYESLKATGKLIIKTYDEMIEQALEYHKNFILIYDTIKELKMKQTVN